MNWMDAKEHPEWIEKKQWMLLDFGNDVLRRYMTTRCPKCELHVFSNKRPVRWAFIEEPLI